VDEKLSHKVRGLSLEVGEGKDGKKRGWQRSSISGSRRTFLLLATTGEHPFFEEEASNILDARERAIPFAATRSVTRTGTPHVRIGTARYEELKVEFKELALRVSADELATAPALTFGALRAGEAPR